MSYPSAINKILENSDKFVIFYTPECPYCKDALHNLRGSGQKYKGYDMNQLNGGKTELLEILNANASVVGFDKNHTTKPIIFHNGKFIGGADTLKIMLNNI